MLAGKLLAMVLMLAPQTSNDQDSDDAALVRQDKDGRWYVFGEEELDGDVLTPEGELVPWRRPPKHGSLLTVRAHFLPELMRLVLDLK